MERKYVMSIEDGWKKKLNETKRDDKKLCHTNQREKWGEVTSKEEKCSGMKGCKEEWTTLGEKWGEIKSEVELKEERIWIEVISILKIRRWEKLGETWSKDKWSEVKKEQRWDEVK